MKIYICWAGEKGKVLAEILNRWLPSFIQALNPFYSPDDQWKPNKQDKQEIDASRIGLVCLTPDNYNLSPEESMERHMYNSDRISYEVGSLSRNHDKSKIFMLLFKIDPAQIPGSLAALCQNIKFEKADFYKFIKIINAELGDESMSSDNLDRKFEELWPQLKEKVDKTLEIYTIVAEYKQIANRLLENEPNLTVNTNKGHKKIENPYADSEDISNKLWEAEMVADKYYRGGLILIRTSEGWRAFVGSLKADFRREFEKVLDKNLHNSDIMGFHRNIDRKALLSDELLRLFCDIGLDKLDSYHPMKLFDEQEEDQ